MTSYTLEEIKQKNLIIFESIMGSHAYGTSLPTSDRDIRGVFIQPLDDILEYGYVEQVSDEKNDICFYELRRFLNLAVNNNPNVIELLFAPEDCIIQTSDEWKMIIDCKDLFLSKRCRYTFAGYAIDQIKKARGYNKKMNWEEGKMERKTVLDFCYILKDGGSVPFKKWSIDYWSTYTDINDGVTELTKTSADQKRYGLANIDHAHNLYAMYYIGKDGIGIVSDEEKANDVQLTSIPKGLIPVAYLSFNKDGYSTHCTRYKEYQTWLKERNPDRVKMNKEHGKQYDSKNMSHCIRLLDTAIEIATTNNLIVRRSLEHIELLMKIRRGEMEYENLLKMAEEKILLLDKVFEESSLPEKVDDVFIKKLLLSIRKKIYKLNV